MRQNFVSPSIDQLMDAAQPALFEAITTAMTNSQLLQEGDLLSSIEIRLIAKKDGHVALAIEPLHPVTPEPKKDEFAEKIDAYVAKHAHSAVANASDMEVK